MKSFYRAQRGRLQDYADSLKVSRKKEQTGSLLIWCFCFRFQKCARALISAVKTALMCRAPAKLNTPRGILYIFSFFSAKFFILLSRARGAKRGDYSISTMHERNQNAFPSCYLCECDLIKTINPSWWRVIDSQLATGFEARFFFFPVRHGPS